MQQLSQHVGYLKEIVEDLRCVGIGGVSVLQFVSPVLLDVKALIFNFPSDPPSMVRVRAKISSQNWRPDLGQIGVSQARLPGCAD